MKRFVLSNKLLAFSLAAVVACLTASTSAVAGGHKGHMGGHQGDQGDWGPPGSVVRPEVGAYGTTYDELAGAWWNWALAGPTAETPVLDPDGRYCAVRQSGKIWFLAGNFGGAFGEPNPTFRSCRVPPGKALFFPIFHSLFWYPEDGSSVGEVRPKAVDAIEGATSFTVTIDGVPVADPFAYRAGSPPGGFQFNIVPGSITETDFGYSPGPRFPAVADGYWMLVRPLSPGHHTIRIQASASGGFELDVNYDLDVSGDRH
jgi:hypothetical protein